MCARGSKRPTWIGPLRRVTDPAIGGVSLAARRRDLGTLCGAAARLKAVRHGAVSWPGLHAGDD